MATINLTLIGVPVSCSSSFQGRKLTIVVLVIICVILIVLNVYCNGIDLWISNVWVKWCCHFIFKIFCSLRKWNAVIRNDYFSSLDSEGCPIQPRSQVLSSLPPLVVGTETLVTAGHVDRWSRDHPQPGSLFQRLREAEKREPGNEVLSNTPK